MFRNLKKLWNIPFRRTGTWFIEDGPNKALDVPHSKYAGETGVTLLVGSELGKSGAQYIEKIFAYINAPIDLEYLSLEDEEIVPNEYLLSVMRNGSCMFIDTTHKTESKHKSLLMNNSLDLYVSVVNCFSIPGFSGKFPPSDIVVVMQNTRGDFSKMEYEPVDGVCETLRMCNRKTVYRYIEYAFKYAVKNGRKKITVGHRSDECPLSDSMDVEVAAELHKKYPQIELEFMLINQMTRTLIWNPTAFDVLCLNDKYGTFIATIVSGVCGGASLFCATELGDHYEIFKPLQTKLSITDSITLSPYGAVATAVTMLHHLGYGECSSALWVSLMKVMVEDKVVTAEFGGKASDEDVITALLEHVQESACQH